MKKIKLRAELFNGNERISSAGIIRLIASNSPQKPLGVEEMRRRVRILDVLDELPSGAETLLLEDEDQKTLAAAIEAFPWANASKGLLTIIDDVLKPEPVPPPMKLVEKD